MVKVQELALEFGLGNILVREKVMKMMLYHWMGKILTVERG